MTSPTGSKRQRGVGSITGEKEGGPGGVSNERRCAASEVVSPTGGERQQRWRLPWWRVPREVSSVFHGRQRVAVEVASSMGEGEWPRRWSLQREKTSGSGDGVFHERT